MVLTTAGQLGRDLSPSSSEDSELNQRRLQNAKVLELQKQMEKDKRKEAKAKKVGEQGSSKTA